MRFSLVRIFCLKVLNDSLFVLLLLKTKFQKVYIMRDEQKRQIIALRRDGGGVWEHSQSIEPIHQYREILLQGAQPGRPGCRNCLRAVRQARHSESGAETEAILLRCLPEQVVERPSGTGGAEGGLYLYLSQLREGVQHITNLSRYGSSHAGFLYARKIF